MWQFIICIAFGIYYLAICCILVAPDRNSDVEYTHKRDFMFDFIIPFGFFPRIILKKLRELR